MDNRKKENYMVSIIGLIFAFFILTFYFLIAGEISKPKIIGFLLSALPSTFVAVIAFPVIYFFFKRKGILHDMKQKPFDMEYIREYFEKQFITTIIDKLNIQSKSKYSIEMIPRTDKRFEHFPDFVKNASEVMVIGIDLAFMGKASGWFVKKRLNEGMNFKLLMINPNTSDQLKNAINNHDERNTPRSTAHEHVQSAQTVIENLKTFTDSQTKGIIEIRDRSDIPSPSITLVDPTKAKGKIRVELKLFKRNQGNVPYFILTRDDAWYDTFFEHYYDKLWNESEIIYNSSEIK